MSTGLKKVEMSDTFAILPTFLIAFTGAGFALRIAFIWDNLFSISMRIFSRALDVETVDAI